MKQIEVVAAIICKNNKILCVQRGESKLDYISGKYEFPGGKIEVGETEIQALRREIKEELLIEIDVKEKFITVIHEYPDFNITMHSYICINKGGDLVLTEHIDARWLQATELLQLDWAAADIPIVNKLMVEANAA